MSTLIRPTPRRRHARALCALAAITAALLTGCVAEPVKEEPKAEVIPYFAPQPAFAPSSSLPAR